MELLLGLPPLAGHNILRIFPLVFFYENYKFIEMVVVSISLNRYGVKHIAFPCGADFFDLFDNFTSYDRTS